VKKSDEKKREVRFYDEREWRYVSKLSEDSFRYGLDKEAFKSSEAMKKVNEHLWTQDKITFTPKDIKYLIVESEKEVLDLINSVEDIKSEKFSHNEVKLLSSRVITADQIRSDF
jgi:hypothetical protein